jgi:hypothetical protein
MRNGTAFLAGSLALALALAACGSDGGGGAASAPPAQERVVVTAGDTAPFSLLNGRYKLTWKTVGCSSTAFDLKQQDGTFEYRKQSKMPTFTTILVEVPAGTYTLTQGDASCTDWTVTLDSV